MRVMISVPVALLAGRVVNQNAMDQPSREIASVVKNLVAFVARDHEKTRRHTLVLDSGRGISLCEKRGR